MADDGAQGEIRRAQATALWCHGIIDGDRYLELLAEINAAA